MTPQAEPVPAVPARGTLRVTPPANISKGTPKPQAEDGSMETVIIVIHLMVVLALIALILVQRSEGGALGIGGGGGGNMFSSRGTANLLTRTTTILAIVFFATTLALTILARQEASAPSILDATGDGTGPAVPLGDDATRGTGEGILDALPPSPALQDDAAPVPVPGGADGGTTGGAPRVPVTE